MPKNIATDVFQHIDMHDGDTNVCWEWKRSVNSHQRPTFQLDGKRRQAYRIVYELVHGIKLDDKQMLLHTCDNSICCNPYHLRIGTHQENMDDMKERQRHGLPHHTVRAIRNLLTEARLTQKEIAENFGISAETVSAINTGRIYKDVR